MEKSTQATSAFAFYCFLIAVYLSVGGLLQFKLGMWGIGVNEIFLLAVPALLYTLFTQHSLKKTFPIRLPAFRELVLVLLMTSLVIAGVELLIQLQEKVWPVPRSITTFYETLMARQAWWQGWVQFFILALIPALCEELFFRGLLMSHWLPYFGKWKSVVLTALLFAVAHVNPWYFLYYFLLGMYLGYLRSWRNNLLLCVLAHLLNNVYSLYA